MKPKKTLEDEINAFLQIWNNDDLLSLIKELSEIFELYDVSDDDDWIKLNSNEDHATVRIVRTVYLISRIAELFSGKLCITKIQVPRLYERLEQSVIEAAQKMEG